MSEIEGNEPPECPPQEEMLDEIDDPLEKSVSYYSSVFDGETEEQTVYDQITAFINGTDSYLWAAGSFLKDKSVAAMHNTYYYFYNLYFHEVTSPGETEDSKTEEPVEMKEVSVPSLSEVNSSECSDSADKEYSEYPQFSETDKEVTDMPCVPPVTYK